MKKLRRIAAAALALVLCASLMAPASASSYTVVKSDSLWSIAQKHLGRGTRWTEIYEANKDVIKNPGSIYVGQVLNIPDGSASAPVETVTPSEEPVQPSEEPAPSKEPEPEALYQLADAGTPTNVDFSCVVSSSGEVKWQTANATFASLAA